MRRIDRPALSTEATAYLGKRTQILAETPNPSEAVSAQWKAAKSTKAFEEILGTLLRMASGRERCMYCEDSAGTDIEHFYPKSRYPARAFDWDNYLLACSHCNSNRKRDRFPRFKDGRPKLIDPTADDPADHLKLIIESGEFASTSPEGLKSIDVFGLNRERLTRGRVSAWMTAISLIREYRTLRASNAEIDQRAADEYLRTIREAPFASVLATIGSLFAQGRAGLDWDVCDAVTKFPEMFENSIRS